MSTSPSKNDPQWSGLGANRNPKSRMILVVGSERDKDNLDKLTETGLFGGWLDLGARDQEDRLDFWEHLADRVRRERFLRLPHLELAVRAATIGFPEKSAAERLWRALDWMNDLRTGREHGSSFLHKLNNNVDSEVGVGALGLQVPWRVPVIIIRWLCFGLTGARSRFKRATTAANQWMVDRANRLRRGVAQIRDRLGAEDRAAGADSGEGRALAQLYRRAFLLDCIEQRIELVFAGALDGDRAAELLAELQAVSEGHGAAEVHSYEREPLRDAGPVPAGSGRGLVSLIYGPAEFARWHYCSFARRSEPANPEIEAPTNISRRRVWIPVTSGIAAIALVAAVIVYVSGLLGDDCGLDFGPNAEGRCSPVSDGTNCLKEEMRKVCEVIAEQNEAIEGDYFTIVVALPMTFEGDDSNLERDIVNQLQGAAAAQESMNTLSPRARLLLADLGSQNSDWEDAAEAILAIRKEENIVAVTGFGSSYEDTKEFIEQMAVGGIVAMGSTITGDDMISGGDGPNMTFRVSPTNGQEAQAIADFIQIDADICETLIVVDIDKRYSYAASLEKGFKTRQDEACGGRRRNLPLSYNGSEIRDIETAIFNRIVKDMCEVIDGDTQVLFAGLSLQALPEFLASLKGRSEYDDCSEHRITLITGDNTSSVLYNADFVQSMSTTTNLELYFVGLAHPDQWENADEGISESAKVMNSAVGKLTERFSGEENFNLLNGQALMAFEAVFVICQSARLEGSDVDSKALAERLRNYNDIGLSGRLQFDPEGNPIDKTMVMLRATGSENDPVEVVGLIGRGG
jgi:ABC-type branched-subunit amino acid transport system substrate-binding protein